MRKDAKTQQTSVTITRVAGYHSRTNTTENYAVQGFEEVRYYTSDRFERLLREGAFYKRPNGKVMLGFGLEIETECWGISNETVLAETLNKIILAEFPTGLFKLQSDGSLRGDSSAEIITQVMTREFIRNHYADFKKMYDYYFKSYSISAARTGNCGMHCNISLGNFGKTAETQAEAVRKLFYLINKHYDFFCALLRRDPSRTRYCSRMDYRNARTLDFRRYGSDHGVCLNLGHFYEGRVEIRLVGGQKDFASFRNTMESIFFIVSRVCKISWADCDDLGKVFKDCNSYVFDRLTLCRREERISAEAIEAIRPTVQRVEYI